MTARIQPLDPAVAQGHTQELFGVVKSKMGKVPNLLKTLGHSPAALEAYLSLSGALSKGSLAPAVREQLALAVSQLNRCEYCLSAHTLTGKLAGLGPEAIRDARLGRAADPKTNALLQLAADLVEQRGDLTNEQFASARTAGVSDSEFAEVVGHVAVNTLTNYFNQLNRTDVDFPAVALEV
jgi:uncharacterized peroxidase-related enzyme